MPYFLDRSCSPLYFDVLLVKNVFYILLSSFLYKTRSPPLDCNLLFPSIYPLAHTHTHTHALIIWPSPERERHSPTHYCSFPFSYVHSTFNRIQIELIKFNSIKTQNNRASPAHNKNIVFIHCLEWKLNCSPCKHYFLYILRNMFCLTEQCFRQIYKRRNSRNKCSQGPKKRDFWRKWAKKYLQFLLLSK